jgi:hypothetical protein
MQDMYVTCNYPSVIMAMLLVFCHAWRMFCKTAAELITAAHVKTFRNVFAHA